MCSIGALFRTVDGLFGGFVFCFFVGSLGDPSGEEKVPSRISRTQAATDHTHTLLANDA